MGRYRYRPGYPDEHRYWPEPVPPAPGPIDNALRLLETSIQQGAIIVAIGPFTNLALLEERSPGILARSRLVVMGGLIRPIRPGFPQWPFQDDYNVQMDTAAMQRVCEAGDPLIVPVTASVETALRRAYLPGLRRAGPLGALVARQGEAHDADHQTAARYGATCPALPADVVNFQHDPLAVAVALGWDGATIERLPLAWRTEDGWLRGEEQPGGRPTAVVTAIDGPRFNELWYRRLVST
jgi:inosine-uridine nucleoside N-ribohydrolase